MTKINKQQIIEMLQINDIQFEMALYSGRLPPPDSEGNWYLHDIDYILKRWNAALETKRKIQKYDGRDVYDGRNIQSGEKMEFPKHTR